MKKIVMTLAAAIAVSSAFAAGVTSSGTQSVVLTLEPVIQITPEEAGDATATFASVADIENGKNFGAQTWTVKSNKPFEVTATAGNATDANNFTFNGVVGVGSHQMMPLTALNLKVTEVSSGMTIAGGFGSYTSLATGANTIATGEIGVRTIKTRLSVTPSFQYEAGAYATTLTVTATQQ